MKSPLLKFAALFSVCLVSAVVNSEAQGTFHFDLSEALPGGIGFMYGGFGSLAVDASVGQFQVNVVEPYAADSFSPVIATPSGTLTFSLGTGVPVWIPLDPFGDGMSGVQYTGSFVSSVAVLSDLLAGQGVFRLISDSPPVVLSGSVEPIPEPSLNALLLCGMLAVFWRKAANA